MIERPRWNSRELETARNEATELFRKQRLEEPLEAYLDAFEEYQGSVEDLLETTVDLNELEQHVGHILADKRLMEVFRYLSGPPISADDLKTLADAVLTPSRLKKDVEMARRLVQVVMSTLDRRRFPWVGERREPTEPEREAAVLASAALLAARWVLTDRRNAEKTQQENQVEEALLRGGLTKGDPRKIETLSQAPRPGHFCRESMFGNRKADFVVGLWDSRAMAIECKVSNSATNSVKRLNNDAAAKAEVWMKDFGERQVVPAAVLGGVYKLNNLEDAQRRGLALFWAHDLGTLTDWIGNTRS